MGNAIEFPGLGLSFDINRVAFTIFGQPIFWYGIIVGIGFAVGAYIVTKRAKRFGLDADRAVDALIAATISGIIGARLYYVIFRWEMYAGNLASIFHLREGGLAFYGGVIGGILGLLLICKWRKMPQLPVIDLFSSVVLISLAIGRWGNFVNVEAFGSNTTAPWGMTGNAIVNYLTRNQARLAGLGIEVLPCTPVHPTFLYESLWNILGFVLIALYIKRRRFDGEITLLFLGWYGLGRAFIEGMRIDSLMLGGLRVSQGVAVLCFVVCAILLVRIHRKIKASGDPDYLALYVNTIPYAEEAAALLEGDGEAAQPDGEAQESEEASEDANVGDAVSSAPSLDGQTDGETQPDEGGPAESEDEKPEEAEPPEEAKPQDEDAGTESDRPQPEEDKPGEDESGQPEPDDENNG